MRPRSTVPFPGHLSSQDKKDVDLQRIIGYTCTDTALPLSVVDGAIGRFLPEKREYTGQLISEVYYRCPRH